MQYFSHRNISRQATGMANCFVQDVEVLGLIRFPFSAISLIAFVLVIVTLLTILSESI